MSKFALPSDMFLCFTDLFIVRLSPANHIGSRLRTKAISSLEVYERRGGGGALEYLKAIVIYVARKGIYNSPASVAKKAQKIYRKLSPFATGDASYSRGKPNSEINGTSWVINGQFLLGGQLRSSALTG